MISLNSLNQATKQEVFDHVARHLLTQKERSIIEGQVEACAYLGIGGLKCAAGCLITTEEYAKYNFAELEGDGWQSISDDLNLEHGNLISRLQDIHDTYDPDEWKKGLHYAAKDYELHTGVLDEFN